jgi:putative oxidoreductase
VNLLRTAGRVALSAAFLYSGQDVLRHPEKPSATAGWLFDAARPAAPVTLPPDVVLVRTNAAVQLLAGTALALGRREKLAATVLIGSLVPTTVGGHAFWRHDDPAQRKLHQIQFGKNTSLLGGLLTVLGTSPSPRRRRRKASR